MPTYTRRTLRQKLGTVYLRDTLVSKTTGSWGATASLTVVDSTQADLSLSGEEMYQRAWVRLLGPDALGASLNYLGEALQDARVASFDYSTGAYRCLVAAGTGYPASTDYELHTLLPPAEKDLCLTEAAKRILLLSELAIESVDGLAVYSLGSDVGEVRDVRFRPYPTASRNDQPLKWWETRPTWAGQEVRLASGTPASGELVLDVVTTGSLGSSQASYIELPDDEGILVGAAAHAYWLLERRAPSQEVKFYQQSRAEMMQQFRRRVASYLPPVQGKVQLDRWE